MSCYLTALTFLAESKRSFQNTLSQPSIFYYQEMFNFKPPSVKAYTQSYIELDTSRIQTLTDAIFAVAMTIIILEIKLPPDLSSHKLVRYFFHNTLPELLIYFISFVILGNLLDRLALSP
jgi:hypothetical protein